MDQQVAKGFAQGARPPSMPCDFPLVIDRRIQGGNLASAQDAPDDKITSNVEAVVLFVAHGFAVHLASSLRSCFLPEMW